MSSAIFPFTGCAALIFSHHSCYNREEHEFVYPFDRRYISHAKEFWCETLTYPQPVFILAAYDEHGVPNAMNAAWGGISEENEFPLCISAEHKTTENILARKAFTISMADAAHVTACDYVGIVSGNDVPDKVARPSTPRKLPLWTHR